MVEKAMGYFIRTLAWSAVALASLIGLWLAVSYIEYDVCIPGVLKRLGIEGSYVDLVAYSRGLLLTGSSPAQVEAALTSVGTVQVTSERAYSGQILRTYRVSVCYTPLTIIEMGTVFDRNGQLI